jgi:PKD repeat protein
MKNGLVLIFTLLLINFVWAANTAPSNISLTAIVQAENTAIASTIGDLSANDVDVADIQSFSLVAGVGSTDNASFSILGTALKNAIVFNYELKTSYSIRIRTSDGNGGIFEKVFTISVNNVNETPSFANNMVSLAENTANTTLVTTFAGSDVDAGQTLTYAIVSGNTSSAFAVNAANGKVTVNSALALNYETITTFALVVRATDNGTPSLYKDATLTINLTDVNEIPTYNNASVNIAENKANASAVITCSGSDVDAGQTLTYSIVSGNTGSAFAINAASGQITVNNSSSVDFESTPVFTLTLRASDNGAPALFKNATLTITLTNVNDAPALTVPGAQVVFENTNLTIPGIALADQDIALDSLAVCVSAVHGFVSLSTLAGLRFTAGDGVVDATICFKGRKAAVSNALNNLVYKSIDDYVGVDAITITANDGGSTGPGGNLSDVKVIALTVNPIAITFNSQPLAATVCQSRSALFVVRTNGTNPISYQWQHNNVNIAGATDDTLRIASVALADSFQYRCVVTNPAGTVNSATVLLKVNAIPKLSFSSNEVCLGNATVFTNTSIIDQDTITSYHWDFANAAAVSTLKSPNYIYSVDGTFQVSMIGTSPYGCKDTLKQAVVVDPLPQLNVVFSDLCFADSLAPINSSSIHLGTIAYAWNFGDGSGSAAKSPKHKYVSTDTYIVSVSATSNKGCVASMNKTITVNPSPMANFVVTDICDSTEALFQSVSSISSGSIAHTWNLDDGTIVNADVNPKHLYLGARTYDVQLKVLSDKNCADSVRKDLIVHSNPQLLTGGSDVDCSGASNGVISVKATAGLVPYFYSLDFGDYQLSPKFESLAGGIHHLRVVDFRNCVTERDILIREPSALGVQAASILLPICSGSKTGTVDFSGFGGTSPYRFQNTQINGDYEVLQDSGHFGNMGAGSYELKITDNHNCFMVFKYKMSEPTPLLISVDKSNVSCLGLSDGVLKINAAGGNGAYVFSVNGGSSYFPTSQFLGLSAGYYLASLKDVRGCSASQGVTVLEPNSKVHLSATVFDEIVCKGDSLGRVKLQGTGGSGVIQYAKGTMLHFDYPSEFDSLFAGTYRFYAKDNNNCMDSTSVLLSEPAAALHLDQVITQDLSCFGKKDGSISIQASGGSTAYNYSLYNSFGTASTFHHLSRGAYTAKVKDKLGCVKTKSVIVNEPTPVHFSVSSVLGVQCKNDNSAQLSLTLAGGVPAYQLFVDGTLHSAVQPMTGFTGGAHSIQLKDQNNCTFDSTVVVPYTYELAKADFTPFVVGKVMTVNNTSLNANSFDWDFGAQIQHSTLASPIHIYPHAGDFDLTLIARNSCNSDTMTKSVNIGSLTVEEEASPLTCVVFPSPASTQLQVRINSTELYTNSTLRFQIFDVVGKMLLQQNEMINGWSLQCNLPLQQLAAGSYFLKISGDNITIVRSFSIQQ